MRVLSFAAVLGAFFVGFALWAQVAGYVSAEEKLPLPPPEQPIAYSHKTHLALGLKCLDCHAIPDPGFAAGYPSEEKCMACHAAIKIDSEEIKKLAALAKKGEPVPWVKIYRVPDYVWFSHASHHTDAGIACETCHGLVAERERMFKEKPTNMVACMDCHAKHSAPNDCDLCHDPA